MTNNITQHASKRAQQRGFSLHDIADILRFGRKQHAKGAVYYSIGKKEIHKHQKNYSRLKQMNGMHVVMAANGSILTVFKNTKLNMIH